MLDIFAYVLTAVVLVAGIWCIWFENFRKESK